MGPYHPSYKNGVYKWNNENSFLNAMFKIVYEIIIMIPMF